RARIFCSSTVRIRSSAIRARRRTDAGQSRAMQTSQKQLMLIMACGSIALAATISANVSADQSGRPPSAQGATTPAAAATPARELVTTYCVPCHNQRLKTANLALDNVDAEHVFNSADTW